MENRVAISLKLPPSLLQRLEAVRAKLPARPSKTACHEAALTEWIERQELAARGKRK